MNPNGTRYTTADNLGSPRVVTNSSASLVSRHDYMPFGEELFAGVGGRTTAMGFPGSSDGLRQKFTSKERDVETGLDYFGARFFASTQGRFNSADPLLASGQTSLPQSWNRYSYVLNNPLRLVDPLGLAPQDPNKDKDKPQPVQQPAQPAPTPQTVNQVPTSVAVTTVVAPNTMFNTPFNGALFTGVGTILALTPLDQKGSAIPNVTIKEQVIPAATTINPDPVKTPDGTVNDLVGRGDTGVKTPQQAVDIIKPLLEKPNTVSQTHVMTMLSPSLDLGVAVHTRTLTNVNPATGQVNPFVNPATGRSMSNYTFTRSPVTVYQFQPRMICPRF